MASLRSSKSPASASLAIQARMGIEALTALPVFHFIYRWLYERSQRRDSFKLPPDASGKIGLGFGDYIRGQSRSGSMGAYDLLNRRKKRMKWVGAVVLLGFFCWLLMQLIYAVSFYGG